MRSIRLWLLATPIVITGACGACSNGAPPDAGVDSAPPDAGGGDGDAGQPCTPAPRPSYVPAGWVPYDDYAPCSGLYVPTDASQLPPPIVWQACEAAAGTAGCRRIQLNWSPLPNPTSTGAEAVVTTAGRVIVVTGRDFGAGNQIDHRLMLVADADGPVYSAVLATQFARFAVTQYLPPAISPSRWIFRVLENLSFAAGGYVNGTTTAIHPSASLRFSSGEHDCVAGDLGVLDIASNAVIGLLDFDSGAKILDIKTPSLPMSFEWMFRDQVYWQGNSDLVDDVGRWTPDGGAIDFINYGFDPNHGAGSLGTDGIDMVWFEETGIDDAGAHAAMAYWTSPYVTDPAKLQPRRLRSEIPNTNAGPIAVGCGYAAYASLGLRVVRLSDGWSWYLPNVLSWNWQEVAAITCNEVFARVAISGPITTMARVALDQLGAGVAPD